MQRIDHDSSILQAADQPFIQNELPRQSCWTHNLLWGVVYNTKGSILLIADCRFLRPCLTDEKSPLLISFHKRPTPTFVDGKKNTSRFIRILTLRSNPSPLPPLSSTSTIGQMQTCFLVINKAETSHFLPFQESTKLNLLYKQRKRRTKADVDISPFDSFSLHYSHFSHDASWCGNTWSEPAIWCINLLAPEFGI